MKPKQKANLCPRHKRSNNNHRNLTPSPPVELEKLDSRSEGGGMTYSNSPSTSSRCSSVLDWNSGPASPAPEEVGLEGNFDEDLGKYYDSVINAVREKREQLVERLRIYNSVLKFHKDVKEDQVYLYRKLQQIDELYLRNTAAILRLGFCPCLVHQQTSPVGDKLMSIHRKLRIWDKKVEEISEVVKEPSTKKTARDVMQILKICETSALEQTMLADFSDVALPEIVWDLENSFIEQVDVQLLTSEWRSLRNDAREILSTAELKFQEICLEFGIRRGPAEVPTLKRPINFSDDDMEEDEIDKLRKEIVDNRAVQEPEISSSFL